MGNPDCGGLVRLKARIPKRVFFVINAGSCSRAIGFPNCLVNTSVVANHLPRSVQPVRFQLKIAMAFSSFPNFGTSGLNRSYQGRGSRESL
jgi:hypothetical protein